MNNVIKIIALVVLTLIIVLTYMNKAQAGGPWNDQYCNVKTTQVKMVDTNGVVIKEYTEEVVQCDDGAKDFLHGYGIADSCQVFEWKFWLGNTVQTQRDIACHKMDGGYEIVEGYHNIE